MRLLLAQEPDIVVVREAVDVDEAVSAAAFCRPDVVLLDWDLSRPSSSRNTELTVSSLRVASPGSFVIALSGLPEARREALTAGVDAFVSKGDPPEELLAAVQGCRRKKRRPI
jgi:DNA-binding NarL/FixJ family response regulator